MPNVYKPGLLQIRAFFTKDVDSGDSPENVTWWQSTTLTTPTLANLSAIAAVFDTGWSNMWKQIGHTSLSYIGSTIIDWSSNTGLEYSSVGVLTPISGIMAGQPMAPNVAALISYNSGERFRGGHFRTYLPYISTGGCTGTSNDQLNTSAVGACSGQFVVLGTQMNASGVLGGQTQMLYRHRNNLTLAQLYPIKSFGVQARLASQRRRLRKAAHK